MSQTNPRKVANRTPNGTDTSPAAASSDAPAQPVPQPIHHPLPKHPHTYIPAHLKSNGPRTQHPRGRSASSKPNTPATVESPEIKALRQKYSDQLTYLKETFSDWSDEDLLGLLAESNGNGDSVASKILEGRVEHWDSVSHKKKDKGGYTGVTGGPQTAARDRAEAGGSASPGIGGAGRGGFRGGRGGTPGRGGMRGGRGGGGRGSYANGAGGYGKVALTFGDVTAATPVAESAPGVAGDWGSTDPSTSTWGTEGASTAWGESTNGASKEKEAPVSTKTPPVKAQQQSSKAPAKPPVPAGPPKMSWAQIAKKGKPAEPPAPVKAPAPVPPSLPVSTPAQVIPEPTPSEPPAAPEPEPTPQESTASPEEPAALELQSAEEDGPEEATTAPSDDWIAVTPPNQQIPVELPAVTAPAAEEPKPVEPEVKAKTTETAKAPEPTPTQQPSSVSTLQPTGAPPGLSPVPQPAPTPSSTTVTSPAATVASTTATSVPTKTSTPRLASSRPASRFRTTDAPVVMPGGGLPTAVFGGLSFGNAVNASGASFGGSGLESRFGMQFGSLSLNDDIDSGAPLEPPAAEVSAPTSQPEPPAPAPLAEAEPSPVPAPAPVPVQAPVPTQAPAPAPQPTQPTPQPVVAPQSTAPAQPAQQSPRVLSSSTAINSLFQHAQQPAQQSLPQQVTATPSLNATQQQQTQQPTPTAPSKVDTLPPFLQQGAPGLLSHLQQQQSHHVQPSQQQAPASHLPPHLTQPQQLGSPAQQSQQLAGSQPQQSLPYNVGGGQHLPPHLDTSSLPQTQQPASATSISAPHPALAAQNSYFRNAGAESAFYHAPTPPQTQLPQQLQQDHSSPYGAFSSLGQPQQTQGGHLGGFGSSPAAADYGGYDAQRGAFYDSYAQGSNFQNRPQLAHDEPAKGGLQPSTPTNVLPGQQNLNLGQGQPGGAQSGVANPGPGGFGIMPYHYYQQPAYFPPPVPAQYNPYSQYKYGPYSQPPPGPGGPGPQGIQGNKPPTAGTASPYGSQHYPSQSTPYDDPTSVGYQQGTGSATDYQKQQPLYGQGLQNFFGNQSTGQNGPQLGGAQGARAGATSSSPENPYKAYGGGPGVGADKGAAGQQSSTSRNAGGPGPQPQQGGYYPNNQYSAQRQPPAQGYPQGDGQQQYYSGYQPRNQYGGGW